MYIALQRTIGSVTSMVMGRVKIWTKLDLALMACNCFLETWHVNPDTLFSLAACFLSMTGANVSVYLC